MPTLDWLNREAAFRTAHHVPTRVLRPHPAAPAAIGKVDETDNLPIQGDNLEALAALLPFYRGRVKCIFIDPPYNTKSAFEHYNDNLEHSHLVVDDAAAPATAARAAERRRLDLGDHR